MEYRKGGRRIELFLPIEYQGTTITEIVLRPFTIGDELRWRMGRFDSVLDLLAAMAGLNVAAVEKIAYPDALFVIDAFMAYLPPAVAQSITGLETPRPSSEREEPPSADDEARMREQFGPDWRTEQPDIPTSFRAEPGAEDHPHIPDFPMTE